MLNNKGVSLKVIVTVLLLAFSILPLAVFSAQIYGITSADLNKMIWDEKQKIADLAAGKIEDYIQNAQNAVSSMAEQPAVKDFSNVNAQKESITAFKNKYPQLQYVYVMDKSGKITSVAPEEGWTDTDFGDRDWFKQVVDTDSPYISDSFISSATNEPMIFIVFPIKNNGQFQGAIGADVDLKDAGKYIQSLNSGKTGVAFAIDKNSTFVIHPQQEYVTKQQTFKNKFSAEVLAGKKGSGEYNFDGIDKVAAYSPVKSLGWGVFFAQDKSESLAMIKPIFNRMIIMIILCVIIAVLLGYLISSKTSKAINKFIGLMRNMAEGDLSNTDIGGLSFVNELNLITNAFKNMGESLRNLVKKVRVNTQNVADSTDQLSKAADQVSTSVEELAEATQGIAGGAQNQAQHSTKIMEHMQAMTNSIQAIYNTISKINDEFSTVKDKALGGKDLAEASSEKMKSISLDVGESINALSLLEEESNKISEIVGIITQIAEQTNLLSLNAAIEAARAGEQGRGFAVVANEIRKLADQSSKAAKQIEDLIKSIQDKTRQYVKSMGQTGNNVKEGASVIVNAGISFSTIAESVSELPDKIQKVTVNMEKMLAIAEESQEKTKNIAGISQELAANTEEMAASTEEQSASMQQMSSTIKQLSQMTEDLNNETKKFKL